MIIVTHEKAARSSLNLFLSFLEQDVNDRRLTSFAGGADDGENVQGALMTVGGYNDNNANPEDPLFGTEDDELYSLIEFLAPGESSINVNTTNPSTDDNIFFAAVFTTLPSSITVGICGNGIREGSEECDDNNQDSGDGCSATCEFEVIRGTDPHDASSYGDPHFKTWSGKHYDFHGVCDLLLLQSKEFESDMDLDVQIRTHMRRDMSYISNAAVRIGADILELQSHGVYHFNGVAGVELPSKFAGFEFLHTQPTAKQHVFEIHLGGRERIKLKTYKDFVSVSIEQGQGKHFANSVGLMGDFAKGRMFARDGETVLDDANVFGQEWQVLNTEESLFQTLRLPQHPLECTMPTPVQASQLRRRLSEKSKDDQLAAEKACEHWGDGKDECVFDVLTTGDLGMAVGGAY
jgi:cysteine-rich repeat protein